MSSLVPLVSTFYPPHPTRCCSIHYGGNLGYISVTSRFPLWPLGASCTQLLDLSNKRSTVVRDHNQVYPQTSTTPTTSTPQLPRPAFIWARGSHVECWVKIQQIPSSLNSPNHMQQPTQCCNTKMITNQSIIMPSTAWQIPS